MPNCGTNVKYTNRSSHLNKNKVFTLYPECKVKIQRLNENGWHKGRVRYKEGGAGLEIIRFTEDF
jgi:hypothetical protein